MNKTAVIFWLVLMQCAAVNVFARGGTEQEQSEPATEKVEVSGTVRLVGSSPRTSLVISGENREWHIADDEQRKLMHLQQQTVKVKAQEYYYDRFFANGTSAGRDYYLKNIVIIETQ